jgi:hypothetical protein
MALSAPVGHGPLDVDVRFNREPPLYYQFIYERDIVFSQEAKCFNEMEIEGRQYEILPEREGLFGIALKPQQGHYHNFLYPFGDTGNNVVQDNYKIANGLSGKDNFLQHFGWRVAPGWYKEKVGTELIKPLIHGEDYTAPLVLLTH